MLVGILKKLVGIMIGPVGILKNACRYFETVGIMNVGIMNVGIMNATPQYITMDFQIIKSGITGTGYILPHSGSGLTRTGYRVLTKFRPDLNGIF